MIRTFRHLALYAAISSSFVLPAYATTTILPGETYESDYMLNSDLIDNQGHLINNNFVHNYSSGAQYVNSGLTDNFGFFEFYDGSSLYNYGQFNNATYGWIELSAGSNLLNAGVFNNSGRIVSMYDYSENIVFTNTNTLNNAGEIYNFNFINNSGAIINQGTMQFDILDNSGDISNQGIMYSSNILNNVTGVISNLVAGKLSVFKGFINYGALNNDGFLELWDEINGTTNLQNYGTVNNTSIIFMSSNTNEINNAGVFNNDYQILGDVGLVINNSGVFNNGSTIESWAEMASSTRLEINNSGLFNNNRWIDSDNLTINNSATFNNNNEIWLRVINNQADGVLNNQGALYFIKSTYDALLNPEMNNAGEFNNYGTMSIVTDGQFVLNNTGTFNQHGQIDNAFASIILNNAGIFNNDSFIDSQFSAINNTCQLNNHVFGGISAHTLNNSSFSEFNNAGGAGFIEINNDGVINNDGMLALRKTSEYDQFTKLNNTGAFTNSGNMVLEQNSDFILDNYGSFNQSGFFETNGSMVTINNYGVFNSGQFSAYLSDLRLGNNGVINNQGEFNSYGDIQGGNNSEINNAGSFTSIGSIKEVSRLINSGIMNLRSRDSSFDDINNQSGGVLNNYIGGSSWLNGVTINQEFSNQGTINNFGQFTINGSYSNRPVVNEGIINNVVDVANGLGDSKLIINSDFTNAGVLYNSAEAEVTMYGPSNINTGTIANDGVLMVGAGLTNDGLITGAGIIWGGLVITEAGTLAPGSTDIMMYGRSMTVEGNIDMNGTLAMNADFYNYMNVFGNVELGENSVLNFSFYDSSYFALGQTFDLVSAYDIAGSFGSFDYDSLFDNNLALQWEILEGYGLGDLLRVTVVSAVPVPAAAWLFMSGLAGLIGAARKRKVVLH
jgi:hypothetical protein